MGQVIEITMATRASIMLERMRGEMGVFWYRRRTSGLKWSGATLQFLMACVQTFMLTVLVHTNIHKHTHTHKHTPAYITDNN